MVIVKRLPWYVGMQRVAVWSLCLSTMAHVAKTDQGNRCLDFLLFKYELFSQEKGWSILLMVVKHLHVEGNAGLKVASQFLALDGVMVPVKGYAWSL